LKNCQCCDDDWGKTGRLIDSFDIKLYKFPLVPDGLCSLAKVMYEDGHCKMTTDAGLIKTEDSGKYFSSSPDEC